MDLTLKQSTIIYRKLKRSLRRMVPRCFLVIFLSMGMMALWIGGCSSAPTPPNWVKTPPKVKDDALLSLGKGQGPKQMALKEGKERAIGKLKKFLKRAVENTLDQFRLEIGGITTSKAFLELLEDSKFREKIVKKLIQCVKLESTYYDPDRKEGYSLVAFGKNHFTFLLNQELKEKLQNLDEMPQLEKKKISSILEEHLVKIRPRLLEDYQNYP